MTDECKTTQCSTEQSCECEETKEKCNTESEKCDC
jgi:hypothetical protein